MNIHQLTTETSIISKSWEGCKRRDDKMLTRYGKPCYSRVSKRLVRFQVMVEVRRSEGRDCSPRSGLSIKAISLSPWWNKLAGSWSLCRALCSVLKVGLSCHGLTCFVIMSWLPVQPFVRESSFNIFVCKAEFMLPAWNLTGAYYVFNDIVAILALCLHFKQQKIFEKWPCGWDITAHKRPKFMWERILAKSLRLLMQSFHLLSEKGNSTRLIN